MYEAAMGQPPTDLQVARLESFVGAQAQLKNAPPTDPRVWEDLAHTLFNTKDFIYLR